MNVTERDAVLDAQFAVWEISAQPITPGGNGAGTWENTNVKQHYVRAMEQVGTDRYRQVVLTALNIGAQWFLSDEPDAAETARQEMLDWLNDNANRPWVRVISWQYERDLRSASLTAVHNDGGGAFSLHHYVVARVGASFQELETTERIRL